MTDFNVRAENLRAMNSLTKYPSILTYHTLDPRNGDLLDDTVQFAGMVIGDREGRRTWKRPGRGWPSTCPRPG